MAQNLNRCLQLQEQFTQLVAALSEQLSQTRNSVPDVTGRDYPTPIPSHINHEQAIPSLHIYTSKS